MTKKANKFMKKAVAKKAKLYEGSSDDAKTDFGGGLVVCLVKFARHFENDMAKQIRAVASLKDKIISSKVDTAELLKMDVTILQAVKLFLSCQMKVQEEMEPTLTRGEQFNRAFSHLIEMWANGASDHLYEMKAFPLMGTKLGKAIEKLKSKALHIGHGFDRTAIWTFDDFIELVNQTVKIAVMIDKELKLKPDVGQYD